MRTSDTAITPQNYLTIPHFLRLFVRSISWSASALVVINLLDIGLPLIVRRFVDSLSSAQDSNVILWCVYAYLAAATIQCVNRITWRVLLGRAGVAAATLTRQELVRSILRTPHQITPGRAVAAAHSDAENFARSIDGGVVISIDAAFGVLGIPFVLFYLNSDLAWKVLLPLPFVTLLSLFFDRKVKERNSSSQRVLTEMTQLAEEFIGHAKTIKSHTLESNTIRAFETESSKYREEGKKLLLLEAAYGPGLESFISLGIVSLMVFGTTETLDGGITLGTFLAFHKFIEQLQWPMRAIAQALLTIRKAQVSGERMRQLILELNTERESESVTEITHSTLTPFTLIYSNSERIHTDWVMSDGEMYTLIGPIGSGKSQFLRQLVGIEKLPPFSASIGGIAFETLSSTERSKYLQLVPQEAELFASTIRENVLLGGETERDYSEKDLWRVLDLAQIGDEVRALPLQLDTILGERGTSLSGGQRQRISLARALLRGAKIILIDNCFAGIDAATESKIIQNIRRAGYTCVCVTQRLSTVLASNEVAIIVDKKIESVLPSQSILNATSGWAKVFVESQNDMSAAEEVGDFLAKESDYQEPS